MFKIYDGRECFYQWDSNQRLIVEDATIPEVHFCNGLGDCSLVCRVYEENGLRLVNVPNQILQDNFNMKVYGYTGDYTKHDAVFKIKRRTKPDNYPYEELGTFIWYEEVIEEWQ